MKVTFADLWHPLGGVNITDLGAKRFLFRFYNEVDVDRVLSGSPWHFNRKLLLWQMIKDGEDPLLISLIHADFWLQVHDLPKGFMTETATNLLENFVGIFVAYHIKVLTSLQPTYLRIWVRLDIRQPLRRRKKLILPSGDAIFVKFRYERLTVLCLLCGKLGHMDNFCELCLHLKKEELRLEWNNSIRVPGRRQAVRGSS
ncbi:uncharacterized protein At4g02000-like [Jatropha curcas]|uniref:uncharacterized protein At4g02000-like n=1 Tax=Jatropha curcas TaxID=180498 RepID=UPI0005FBF576|nr:uncharacterized protein At4g02000-like [Jatropha curcas]